MEAEAKNIGVARAFYILHPIPVAPRPQTVIAPEITIRSLPDVGFRGRPARIKRSYRHKGFWFPVPFEDSTAGGLGAADKAQRATKPIGRSCQIPRADPVRYAITVSRSTGWDTPARDDCCSSPSAWRLRFGLSWHMGIVSFPPTEFLPISPSPDPSITHLPFPDNAYQYIATIKAHGS